MKEGLEYFPLDTALDSKFDLIEAEFGIKGFGVVVKLLQMIYGQRGYYTEFDKDIILVSAHAWGVSANLVSDIVAKAIKVGIFDKEMFERYKILTSAGIQKRFLHMTQRRKNSNIKSEYSLIKLAQNPENAGFLSENVCKNEQSKVKEIKENSKKKYGEFENVFLSDEEYKKLAGRFGKEKTDGYIEELSAYQASRRKKYANHYATILSWERRNNKKTQAEAKTYNGVRRFN